MKGMGIGVQQNFDQSQSSTSSQHLSINPTRSFCLPSLPTSKHRELSLHRSHCLRFTREHTQTLVLRHNATVASFIYAHLSDICLICRSPPPCTNHSLSKLRPTATEVSNCSGFRNAVGPGETELHVEATLFRCQPHSLDSMVKNFLLQVHLALHSHTALHVHPAAVTRTAQQFLMLGPHPDVPLSDTFRQGHRVVPCVSCVT